MSRIAIRQPDHSGEAISKLYVVINGLASRIKKLEEENAELKIEVQNIKPWKEI